MAEQFAPEPVTSTVDVLAELVGEGGLWNSESGRGGSRCRWPRAEFRCTASNSPPPWPPGCGRNRGGAEIGVTIGDFATTRVGGDFTLAYLVFNTIMNLTTQDAQVASFRTVAEQLAPGGCFVVCHYLDIAGGTHRSIPFRYVWPAELDLMARLAGLELRHRWADWERRPFTAESGQHVSVWAKAGSGQGPGR
ncbi:hypothetical protein [Nocardia asteroides]|uniref:hypothetical protein n=1 Tax=Nocardia asteroides TaxID=1824 RepID=UPI001E4BEA8B|nr:hypothetical protein [Nocardia asteroides]UGT60734.1 hypothetical protein LTT61_26840 [Nocardia asteroides]